MGRQRDLQESGKVLYGLIKPPWFVGDCSIPTRLGKWFLDADLAVDVCALHDWYYLLIPILYRPRSIPWQMALHQADAQLKWNLVTLRKKRWVGRMWGWVYYRGLRIPLLGGRRAVTRKPREHPRRPRTLEQIADVRKACRHLNNGELTRHGAAVLSYYEALIEIEEDMI